MSNNELNTLYKRSCDAFDDMINDTLLDLEKNNKRYRRLNNHNTKLRHRYPRIAKVFETENPHRLNHNEIDSMMTIINNEVDMKYIMYEKMFNLGFKEAFYYFNRMGIIKEEDTRE